MREEDELLYFFSFVHFAGNGLSEIEGSKNRGETDRENPLCYGLAIEEADGFRYRRGWARNFHIRQKRRTIRRVAGKFGKVKLLSFPLILK